MHFTKLVPSVFYKDLSDGLKLFVDCLQFKVLHQELHISNPYCVLGKDGISIMVFRDEQLAGEHNPSLRGGAWRNSFTTQSPDRGNPGVRKSKLYHYDKTLVLYFGIATASR